MSNDWNKRVKDGVTSLTGGAFLVYTEVGLKTAAGLTAVDELTGGGGLAAGLATAGAFRGDGGVSRLSWKCVH